MQWSRGIAALLVLAAAGCTQPAPVVNVEPPVINMPAPVVNVPAPSAPGGPTYSLNIVSGNQQVGSSGAAFPAPLVVQAVDAKGQGVPDLSINVLTDSRLCSLPAEIPLTNAEGKLSIVLSAGVATDVVCPTVFTLNGQAASSRGSVSFTSFIRPAQRGLRLPTSLALPSVAVGIEDGAQSRFAFSEFRNWPVLSPAYRLNAYAYRAGPNGEIDCVRFLGSFPETVEVGAGTLTVSLSLVGSVPAALTCGVAPGLTGSAAALSLNVVAVVLQSSSTPPSSSPSVVESPFLLGFFPTPARDGTSRADLYLWGVGLERALLFEMPTSAQGVLSLESPYLAYNAYNSGFRAIFSGFPRNPAGYRYAVYRTNRDARTFRVGSFSVGTSGAPVELSYRLPLPSNSNPPGQPLDQKGEFGRVFVTLEPVADGEFPSNLAGRVVVLDTETEGAWTMRVR